MPHWPLGVASGRLAISAPPWIALELAAMMVVVGGSALDGEANACRGSLISAMDPASCRVAFGAGALVLAVMTLAALRRARRV